MTTKQKLLLSAAVTLGLLTLLTLWTFAQGPDGYHTYHVAPSCAGVPVPCYTVVQDAVDAVDDPGDEVKVATGTYTGVNNHGGLTQAVYISKTLTLQGGYTTTNWTISYPITQPTTLDAQGQGRVLYIIGDINPTVEGLRITGGDAGLLAGGIWLGTGGGVCVISATANISDNQIFSNVAQNGGGLYLQSSDATLSRNTVTSNTADYTAGGMHLVWSDATLENNDISSNDARDGGGIAVQQSDGATFSANTVTSNTADESGGGIMISESDATLTNTIIADNQAGSVGSGLYVWDASPQLRHTTIVHNTGGDGSGLHADGPLLVNCYPYLHNTILVSHTVGVFNTPSRWVTLNGVLWYGNTSNLGGDGAVVFNQYTGTPAFMDPRAGDYHIGPGSAAIDKGVNAGTNVDIDGDPRPIGPAPDLGADETPVALRVTKHATPGLVQAGAQLTYTIHVTNTGQFTLTATITDTLPDHVTPTGLITWTPTITAPGGLWTQTIIVTVEMDYTGLLTNVVRVTTEEGASGVYTETATAYTPTPIPGEVLINEIAWSGTGASTSHEWMELRNTRPYTLSLDGCTLAAQDGIPDVTLVGEVGPNAYFLLERDAPATDVVHDLLYVGALDNSGEHLVLTCNATTVDQVDASTGWPAGTNTEPPPHATMERHTQPGHGWHTNNGRDRNGLDASSNPINGTPRAPNSPAWSLALVHDQSTNADPGEVVIFTHVLTNTGGAADTYTLTVETEMVYQLEAPVTTLPAFQSASIPVTVTVPATALAHTLHTAILTARSWNSPTLAANTDTITVNARSALSVTKHTDPDPVLASQHLTYTIYVTNTGNVTLTATVTDTLPDHVTPTGLITWTPTITAPGGLWTQTIIVTPETGYTGLLTNVVRVTTEEGASGVYTHTTASLAPGLQVTKHVDPDPAQAGAPLTYTIYVTNTGSVTLTATVTDTLPDHTSPPGLGGTEGGLITWTPTITAPGGLWTQTFIVTPEMGYAGTLTNVVRVTTEEGASGVYTTTSTVHLSLPQVADVLINEIAWSGTSASTSHEWMELRNTRPYTLSLDGCTLAAQDGTPTVSLAGTITPYGYFLLERDASATDVDHDLLYVGALDNSGEHLVLTCDSTNVDQVDASTGWPAGTNTEPPPHATMERDTIGWYTNDGIHRNGLDAGSNPINGTPRAHNSPPPCTALTGLDITGPLTGTTGTAYAFIASIAPGTATPPITYIWSPTPTAGQGTTTATYAWAISGQHTITATAQNYCSVVTDTHTITVSTPPTHIYLPLVIHNYPPIYTLDDAPDTCPGYGPLQFTPSRYIEDFDHDNDYDWYTFQATAGVTYTIQTGQLEANSDTTLTLFDADCTTQLAENDDIHYPDDVASRIEWTAPSSATYHIRIKHYDWRMHGSDTGYTLTIQENQ